MTSNDYEAISTKFAERLASAPISEHDAIKRSCIQEFAEHVAGIVFLSSHAAVAAAPIEARLALARDIDANAAMVGCDFASQVRRAFYPDIIPDAGATEEELFAARSYWSALERLVATAHIQGGRA